MSQSRGFCDIIHLAHTFVGDEQADPNRRSPWAALPELHQKDVTSSGLLCYNKSRTSVRSGRRKPTNGTQSRTTSTTIPNPQYPTSNPQHPIPNLQSPVSILHSPPPGVGCDNRFAQKLCIAPHPLPPSELVCAPFPAQLALAGHISYWLKIPSRGRSDPRNRLAKDPETQPFADLVNPICHPGGPVVDYAQLQRRSPGPERFSFLG